MPGHVQAESPASPPGRRARSFGIVSTFPPTACGIASFSAALSAGLIVGGDSVDVVRAAPVTGVEDPLVLGSLDGRAGSHDNAGEILERTDVVIVQHEYGIYPGPDGEGIVSLIQSLRVPTVVVAHTVLRAPSANQRRVLSDVCAAADAVVVMTASGREGLIDRFGVQPSKIRVIAHGAATPPAPALPRALGTSPRLLTWGLLGPGKGIEWAIESLAALTDLHPRPRYLIAGATHPRVRASSGEEYRNMLSRRARTLGISDHVDFDEGYRDLQALTDLIITADLVVLPYDSADQVTSGVLVDAVAAGRPVVSTSFPHAVELLGSGAGLVVPQRDPTAMASAIRAVLTDADLALRMAEEARRLAPDLSWNAVASQYVDLADALLTGASTVTR